MSILEKAVGSLRSVQESVLSVPVLYRRSGGAQKTLRAVVGRTVFHSRSDYGTWTREEARDFIVTAAALQDPPNRGDEIVWNGRTYEVLAPNDEPVWRWSDPYCTARRIHTKWTGGKA